MITRRSAPDNGHDRRAAAVDLSSVFGAAAAASVHRRYRPRRRKAREPHEPLSDADELTAAEPAVVEPETMEDDVHVPSSRNAPVRPAPAAAGASGRPPTPPPPRPAPPAAAGAPGARRPNAPAPRRPLGVVKVRDPRHVDLLLLASMVTGPANGRELIDLVRERSGGVFTLSLRVVTHQLHRLANNRLIQVTGDRGARRRYSLTPLGERVLATRRREWEAFSHGLSRVLDAGG